MTAALSANINAVRANQPHEGTLAVGGFDALETLWGLLHPPEPPPVEVEEPFIDPALR